MITGTPHGLSLRHISPCDLMPYTKKQQYHRSYYQKHKEYYKEYFRKYYQERRKIRNCVVCGSDLGSTRSLKCIGCQNAAKIEVCKAKKTKVCVVCNKSFRHRLPQTKVCGPACRSQRYKAYQASYRKGVKKTEKYKSWYREWRRNSYSKSPQYKEYKHNSKIKERDYHRTMTSLSSLATLTEAAKTLTSLNTL